MKRIFLGKPAHWLVLAVVIATLWWMGETLMQTRHFTRFIIILLVMTAAAVGALIVTSRKGDRLTREPFDDTGPDRPTP